MSLNENPSAFPSQQGECLDGSWNQTFDPGMTLRDWFAGQALAGIVREYVVPSNIAEAAYDIADAMLAARAST